MGYRIPFNKPFIVGKELYYIARSVIGGHTSGNGAYTRLCQDLLGERLGARKVLLTTSCTAALEMSALLFNVGPGDEVILPSYTFVSTANAFMLRGARLVFVDIRPDTLNIDERLVAGAVTERTRVIAPVHYAGVGCEMDEIMPIAERHGIRVVEDAAQALGALYKGRPLGGIGDLGALSFHETKNFISGEGGALIINRERYEERAEILWEKGTNRSKFFRGEVDKYTWVDVGSSFLPSDILAAFLYAQLEHMEEISARRARISAYYAEALKPLADDGLISLPGGHPGCVSNSHMSYVLFKDEAARDGAMDYLRERGVLAVFHYLPLHLSPMGRSMGYREGQLPVTEDISGRLLRLPLYFELTEAEQAEVVSLLGQYLRGVRQGRA